MKQVVTLSFLFDFAHESGIKRRKEKLGGSKIVQFVVFVIAEELLEMRAFAVARVKQVTTFIIMEELSGSVR